MNIIAWFAPLFIFLEIAQLFVAHRYIGPEQIRAGRHPLDALVTPPLWLSVGWLAGLWAIYLYQFALFFVPTLVRLASLSLILVSVTGFMLRRVCGLKWGLVIMTLEGALRVGLLGFAFQWTVFPPDWAERMHLNLHW